MEWPRTHCFQLLINVTEGYLNRKNTFRGIAYLDEVLDYPDNFFSDSTFYFVQYSKSAVTRSRMRNTGISGLYLYKKHRSFYNIIEPDYCSKASPLSSTYHYNDAFSELITGN